MADGKVINVTELVDRQKFGPFHLKLMIWLFLVLILDGYDISAASFANPEIIKQWSLAPESTKYFLTASLFGIMFGAVIFGWFGDKFGRKKAILSAALVFAGATIACALSTTLDALTIFRFLCGVGIGGVMPNTISLAAEMAPKRVQATLIILMFTGTPAGSSLPGPIAAWVVPHYGWPMIFWIGGIIPLVIVALLFFTLPESVKFLAQDDRRRAHTAKVAKAIEPTLSIGPDDRFVVDHAAPDKKGSWLELFRWPFTIITPLLASLFIINFVVLYFMNSWMPQLIGVWATTVFGASGALGGVILSVFVDRKGLAPVTVLFALAVPVIAGLGYSAPIPALAIVMAGAAGMCVVGLQFGLNATAGMIYPTHVRSNGVGFAFGIGRFGAVAGPLIGGQLIAWKLPLHEMYLLASIPMAIGAIACYVLTRVQKRARDA